MVSPSSPDPANAFGPGVSSPGHSDNWASAVSRAIYNSVYGTNLASLIAKFGLGALGFSLGGTPGAVVGSRVGDSLGSNFSVPVVRGYGYSSGISKNPNQSGNSYNSNAQSVLGPDVIDVANTLSSFSGNMDRGTRESLASFNNKSVSGGNLSPSPYANTSVPFSLKSNISQPSTQKTETGGTMTPYTLTMEDLAKDPRFPMLKNATEDQYGVARDSIISTMPAGGGLLDRLAGLETDRANSMVDIFGGMSQDIADKQYGKELAKLGASVTLAGQDTQRDIASQQIGATEDMYMNQLYTMMGMAMADK